MAKKTAVPNNSRKLQRFHSEQTAGPSWRGVRTAADNFQRLFSNTAKDRGKHGAWAEKGMSREKGAESKRQGSQEDRERKPLERERETDTKRVCESDRAKRMKGQRRETLGEPEQAVGRGRQTHGRRERPRGKAKDNNKERKGERRGGRE